MLTGFLHLLQLHFSIVSKIRDALLKLHFFSLIWSYLMDSVQLNNTERGVFSGLAPFRSEWVMSPPRLDVWFSNIYPQMKNDWALYALNSCKQPPEGYIPPSLWVTNSHSLALFCFDMFLFIYIILQVIPKLCYISTELRKTSQTVSLYQQTAVHLTTPLCGSVTQRM